MQSAQPRNVGPRGAGGEEDVPVASNALTDEPASTQDEPAKTQTTDGDGTDTAPPQDDEPSVAYEPYSPPSGSYTAELPTSGGWSNQGEQELNPGLLRTSLSGPEAATIWIDVTPAESPGFDTSAANVTSDTTVDGDVREIVFADGGPEFCTPGPCVVYQRDLGSSGVAVLGGPGSTARAVARRVATTLDPDL